MNITANNDGLIFHRLTEARNACCFLNHAGNSFDWNVPTPQQLAAPPSSMVFFIALFCTELNRTVTEDEL